MARFTRMISLFIVAIFFLGAIAFGFVFIISGGNVTNWAQIALLRFTLNSRQDDLQRSVGTDDTPIRFTIHPGDPPRRIAQNLFDSGLIFDPELFVDFVRVEGIDIELEAGTYFLNQTQTISQIAHTLTDSRNSQITFTIIEGWRAEEIAEAINQTPLFGFTGEEFLRAIQAETVIGSEFAQIVALPSGTSLEGFLFPDTYILPPNITAEELRDTLLQAFLNSIDGQNRQDAIEQGLTLYQIVTLASIIEREAIWPDEHPLIASVYRNRLQHGIRLQADPTVQFGLQGSRGSWWPEITQLDYQRVDSPYNTYLYLGLPPGPIANPGLAAIQAAIHPADSDYLYFRANCDGSGYHRFALTYEEHLANACNA